MTESCSIKSEQDLNKNYIELIGRLNKELLLKKSNLQFSEILIILSSFNKSNEIISKKKKYHFDFMIESQLGVKIFGMQFFFDNSFSSIINILKHENINQSKINDSIFYDNKKQKNIMQNFSWKWSWNSWYVLMITGVDDSGWFYLNISNRFINYNIYKKKRLFKKIIRKRVWVKLKEFENN